MKKVKNKIIIIFYKNFEYLDKFLQNIFSNNNEIEFIVINNNGKNFNENYLKKKFKEIKCINLPDNLGFGYSCNLASKIAMGKNLLFINYDSIVSKKTINSFFNEYYSVVNKTRLLVNVKSRNQTGALTHLGKYLTMDFMGFPGLTKKKNRNFYCEGSFLYLSKKSYEYIGGFDYRFFMYVEDVDLSWRAHLYGYKIKSIENYNFLHFSGGSSDDQDILNNNNGPIVSILRRDSVEKSTLRMILKNYSFLSLLFILPIYVLMSLIEALFFLSIGQINYSKVIFFAYLWNLMNLKSTFIERKKIQTKRIKNDIFILKKTNYFPNKIYDFLNKGFPKFY